MHNVPVFTWCTSRFVAVVLMSVICEYWCMAVLLFTLVYNF